MRRKGVSLFAVALAVSLLLHVAPVALPLFPQLFNHATFHDSEDEVTVPIDVVDEDPPPPPPPPPPEPKVEAAVAIPKMTAAAGNTSKGDAGGVDAAVPQKGARDAGALDAATDAVALHDAAVDGWVDAGTSAGDGSVDSAMDAGLADAGAFDAGDAGALLANATWDASGFISDGGVLRDPALLVGGATLVDAGRNQITLVINSEVIRAHPEAPAVAMLFDQIPQWKSFFGDTKIDPLKDLDWIMLYGPSFWKTDRDVFAARYRTSDRAIEEAVRTRAQKRTPAGGPVDAGAPSVAATLGWGDGADRVFLRPARKHLVAVVPPDKAHAQAVWFGASNLRPQRAHEAISLSLSAPHAAIPNWFPDTSISKIRLSLGVRDDHGADLVLEGECADRATCEHASGEADRKIREALNFVARGIVIGYGGKTMLDAVDDRDIEVGDHVVRVHVSLSFDQLEDLRALVANLPNGTQLPAPTSLPQDRIPVVAPPLKKTHAGNVK